MDRRRFQSNLFPIMHGIMFHHFHSLEHPRRPGSLSAEDLDFILDKVAERFAIVSPEEFLVLLRSGSFDAPVVTLIFDDSLRSQFDVAATVLRARGIQAGFAIYSSIYTGDPDPLEIFAAFREGHFRNSSGFWNVFREAVARTFRDYGPDAESGVESGFLRDYAFYSREERLFRFVRDEILSVSDYQKVMWELISREPSFDVKAVGKKLWMNEDDLRVLISEGNSIGLHSHTHPTRMDLLSRSDQLKEYSENYAWIQENLSVTPDFVAFPCGRYSPDTIEVMETLGVRSGFLSSMSAPAQPSLFEIPREDASNLMRQFGTLKKLPSATFEQS